MDKSFLKNMKTLSILYAEDEKGIRKNIANTLGYYFKEVYEAQNGEVAFEIYKDKKPDIVLSDIHMPILNGIDLVKKIRAIDKKTPVVMITAHTDKKYLLEAIELHMEKYIVKPVDIDELFSALKICMKSIQQHKKEILNVDEDYIYDYDKKELAYKNKIIVMQKKEIDFLELLISHQDKVVTYTQLQEYVWGDSVMTDSALRSLVRNLRKKLPTNILSNFSGVGYRLV